MMIGHRRAGISGNRLIVSLTRTSQRDVPPIGVLSGCVLHPVNPVGTVQPSIPRPRKLFLHFEVHPQQEVVMGDGFHVQDVVGQVEHFVKPQAG